MPRDRYLLDGHLLHRLRWSIADVSAIQEIDGGAQKFLGFVGGEPEDNADLECRDSHGLELVELPGETHATGPAPGGDHGEG